MFVSGWFPLPSLPYYESLVSVKENTDRKSIKEERKKIPIEHKPNLIERFLIEKSFKNWKSTCFSKKKNTSNEFNIFLSIKSKKIF